MLILATLCFLSIFSGYQSAFYCLDYDAKESIEIEQLKGQWWEYQSSTVRNPIERNGYDCSVFNFYPEKDKINILQDYIRRVPGIDNKDHTGRGWKITPSNPDSPKIDGKFNGETYSDDGVETQYDYTVVDTDYSSWLLVTVCNVAAEFRGTYVLTRSQEDLTKLKAEELDKKVQQAINKKNIRTKSSVRYTYTAYTTKKNSKCKPVDFPDTI